MIEVDAPLDEKRLRREAPVQASGGRLTVQVKVSTGSTSDDVRALAVDGAPDGTVVFAEEQTHGRGRRGNVWVAPARRCLLFSLLLRPQHDTALWPRVTHLAALAVCRAVEPFVSPAPVLLKWPNDVMIGGRKVAGILLESMASSSGGYLVLGVGLNVNLSLSDFPRDLRASATSLLLETDKLNDRTEVALRFLKEFLCLYPAGVDAFDRAIEEVHQRSCLIGKKVTLNHCGKQESGRVIGFGPGGELKLMPLDPTDSMGRWFSSGELVRVVDNESG